MKESIQTFSIIGAAIGPATLCAFFAEFYYICEWKTQWPQITVLVLTHIAALVILCRLLDWRWWIKLVAAIPFLALSLVATVYLCLMVAAAHGDAL